MDKYEFNIKVEQLKKLVGKNDFETAMKIADTIDWRRVRNTNLLSMVAMVYEKNKDYEEAKEILLLAYERAPIGKRLVYKLAELAALEGNVEEAEDYYREFTDLAQDDPRQQLLRYMILKAKGAPVQQLIHSLESYTSLELDEEWLYELAELYSLAGMQSQCVETCDKIMLMFGLGKYVEKAMELKQRFAPLSNYQMDLMDNRDKYEAKLRAVEQQYQIGGQAGVVPREEGCYDAPLGNDGYGYGGYQPDFAYEQETGYQDHAYGYNAGYDNSGYFPETGYMDNNYVPDGGYLPNEGYGGEAVEAEGAYGINHPAPPYVEGAYDASAGYVDGAYGTDVPYGNAAYDEAAGYGGEIYGEVAGYGGEVYGEVAGYGREVYGEVAGYGGEVHDEVAVYGGEVYGEVAGYGGEVYSVDAGYGGEAYGVNAVYGDEAYSEGAGYSGEANGAYVNGVYVDPGYETQADAPASDYIADAGYMDNGDIVTEDNLESGYESDQIYVNDEYAQNDSYIRNDGDSRSDFQAYDDSLEELEPLESISTGDSDYLCEVSADYDELEAQVKEQEAQEKLAKELSKIAEGVPVQEAEEQEINHTRVLDDIRQVRCVSSAAPVKKRHVAQAPSAEPLSGVKRGASPSFERLSKEVGTTAQSAASTVIATVAAGARVPETTAVSTAAAVSQTAAAETIAGVGRIASAMPRPKGKVSVPALQKEAVLEPVAKEKHEEKQKTPSAQKEPDVDIRDEEEDADKTKKFLNHLMIESRTSDKGLQMAVEALKQIHKETGVKNPVAKITGSKLSKRGVLASAEKLAGKDLIIEEAGDLTKSALDELNELMNKDTTGMIVVLIDNPKQMESLHSDHPVLASKFECIGCDEMAEPHALAPVEEISKHLPKEQTPVRPSVVETEAQYQAMEAEEEEQEPPVKEKRGLFGRRKPVYEEMEPEYEEPYEDEYYEEPQEHSVRDEAGPGSNGEEMDIDEFAQYACKYAGEIDCSITGKSMLALYERIEILEEDGVPLTRVNAEELIEEAADRAEKPSIGKRIKGMFSSKYDKDGLLILKEEHFIY